MDVRAIILVGVPTETSRALDGNGAVQNQFTNSTIFRSSSPNQGLLGVPAVPIPMLPLFGRSPVLRVAEQLIKSGVDKISILSAAEAEIEGEGLLPQINWKNVPPENIWRAAEEEFSDLAQNGAELVLVLRMGPYLEINLDDLLQFHLDQRSRVTQVCDDSGPVDLFVISASRRNDAAHLFRTGLSKSRIAAREFLFEGYLNRLEHPKDFRRLALDSFYLKTAIRPGGQEIRPGVWKERGAKIDRGARIVAPAYIGAYSRVRASALVTRGSVIENHCIVGCGTAVDNSTILPFSHMGPGLDLCNSILSSQQITSLSRDVVVTIEDPKLVRAVSQTASVRLMEHTAELIAYLPRQMWRGFRGEPTQTPVSIAETTNVDMQHYEPPLVNECAHDDSKVVHADLAVMRRYGNQ